MKLLSTGNFDVDYFQDRNVFLKKASNKKRESDEFKKILEEKMDGPIDDLEEFRVLFPTHGRFWDNGYEDKE